MNFKYIEEIKKHRPSWIQQFENGIEKFEFEATLSKLIEVYGLDMVKKCIREVSRERENCTPSELKEHLIAYLSDLSIIAPFDSKEKHVCGPYTFSRITSYREFYQVGRLFQNCLFGVDRFKREAEKSYLLKVQHGDRLCGLVTVQVMKGKWVIHSCKQKRNEAAPNGKEIVKFISEFFEQRGCEVILGRDSGTNRGIPEFLREQMRGNP